MTTDTFTGGTADGHILGQNATYATARSTSTSTDTAGTTAFVGQLWTGAVYRVYRAYIRFDTSSIPDDATISAATLYITADLDGSDVDFLVMVHLFDWAEALGGGNQESNFDGLHASFEEGVLRDTASGWSSGTQYSLSVTTGNVNKTGVTRYGLHSSMDEASMAPVGNEYVQIRTADHATAGDRPQLEVTYTVPSGQPTTVRFSAIPHVRLPGAAGARLGG